MKNRLLYRLLALGLAGAMTLGMSGIVAFADETLNQAAEAADPAKDVAATYEEAKEAQLKAYNDALVTQYYSKSVFIGDSVMVGYRNHVAGKGLPTSGANFLAVTSFSAYHALNPASKDPLQPPFQGKKRNVWESVALMDVDKVFIFFGTNDLVVRSPQVTCDNILKVAEKIKTNKPSVEIIIMSMTPIYSKATVHGALTNKGVAELNTLLQAKAVEKGYGYVDVYSYMLDGNGALKNSYCSDKYVHLTNGAYNVWDTVLYNYGFANAKR